jgi:hypothetical protein
VDEFISFMRGCGFMDVTIYSAMENAVEEHTAYQAHLEKAIELGIQDPIIKLGRNAWGAQVEEETFATSYIPTSTLT